MIAALLLFGLAAAVVPFVVDVASGDEDDAPDEGDLAAGHHGDRSSWPDDASVSAAPDDPGQHHDIADLFMPGTLEVSEVSEGAGAARVVTLDSWDAEIVLTDASEGEEATLSFRTDGGDSVTLVFPGQGEVPVEGIVVSGPSPDGEARQEMRLADILAAAEPVADDSPEDIGSVAVLAPVDPDVPDELPPPSHGDAALAPSDADAPDVPPAEPSLGEALQPVTDDDTPWIASASTTFASGDTPAAAPPSGREAVAGNRVDEHSRAQEVVPAPLRPGE